MYVICTSQNTSFTPTYGGLFVLSVFGLETMNKIPYMFSVLIFYHAQNPVTKYNETVSC